MLRRSRGPGNELHFSVRDGSIERTMALLSRGVLDIDQGDHMGCTPLMIASSQGYAHLATVLLYKGANGNGE